MNQGPDPMPPTACLPNVSVTHHVLINFLSSPNHLDLSLLLSASRSTFILHNLNRKYKLLSRVSSGGQQTTAHGPSQATICFCQ